MILATGSSSFVPPIPGYGAPGSFVLREAEEAMEIRAYVQKNQSKTAVVAGGGLLGLETAYALHKMGLTVWVLERGEWMLRRQLDERGGRALKQSLEALGLMIETKAETAAVHCEDRVCQVELTNGRTLPCDVFIVAVGIQPNVDLAQAAGLDVKRGIIVDETMRTSAPDIFAAGDVCEFAHQVPGLWAVAVEQAKVAAINALGGSAIYDEVVPVTMLKVAGVDVTSMGRFERRTEEELEIAQEDVEGHGYRKLIIADGKLVGAILVGDPANAQTVAAAVKARREVKDHIDALQAGNWSVLNDNVVPSANNAPSKWTALLPLAPVPPRVPKAAAEPQPAPALTPAPIVTKPIEVAPAVGRAAPAVDCADEPEKTAPAKELIAPFEQIEAIQSRIEAQFMAELEALRRTPRTAHDGAATISPRPVIGKGYRTIVIDFKDKTEADEREKALA